MNGEDTSSSSSEEEEKEKEGQAETRVNGLSLKPSWSSAPHSKVPPSVDGKEDEDDEDEGDCLPTIFFSHTVEPKKVRLMNDSEHFFTDLLFNFCSDDFFSSPSFAAGENKHWKKHHAEVQRKERTEGTLEEEKEKRTLASRTPQNHNAGRHLQVKNKH